MYKNSLVISDEAVFLRSRGDLLDDYLSTTFGFAGKFAGFDLFVADYTVTSSVNSEVSAHVGAWASLLSFADLADDYVASFGFLATKKFDAEALTW